MRRVETVPRHAPCEMDEVRSGLTNFSEQVADLLAFLRNELPPDHKFPTVFAQPNGPTTPEPWLLGSSEHGAAQAAQFGCSFSFAHFINPASGVSAVEEYRRRFRPSAWLAAPRVNVCVFVLCADTEREAHRLALSRDLWGLRVGQGVMAPFPSVEEAERYACADQELALVNAGRSSRIVGAPEQVREQLLALAEDYGVDEILVLTVCFDPAARLRSYELIAESVI